MSSFPYKELKKIVLLPTLLVVICWSLFSINYFFNLELFQFGISPRKLNGLVGILVAPMLHVEF